MLVARTVIATAVVVLLAPAASADPAQAVAQATRLSPGRSESQA